MPATTFRRRWSDNDRNFGPFTIAWERSYPRIGVMLCSGDGEHPGASFRFHAGALTALIALPDWLLPPQRTKVFPKWDEATITRLGRNWYYDVARREYGFSISGTGQVGGAVALHVHYGRQTMDSSTEKSKCYFLPWTTWRHVRRSLYDLSGAHFADIPERKRGLGVDDPGFHNHWEAAHALEKACPTASFAFKDYDGEDLTVTTRIEEREWRKGEGRFKWLSWFSKPIVHRSLDLRFSGETGRRKGSWKGGTIGHAVNMEPGELHEAAFRRYCAENGMTFVGPA